MDILKQSVQSGSAVSSEKPVMRNVFEKSSFIVLLLTILLSPIAFIPSTYIPLDMVKTIVIMGGVLISAVLYFISCFKEKNISIPKHPLFIIGCGIVLSLIVSTLLSLSGFKSLFGQGFEIGTTSFLSVLFLGSLLTIYLTRDDRDRVMQILGAVFISFAVIVIFHIIRFIGGSDILTLGILKSPTGTILGKWNDIALFSGVIALLSYIALRFISLKKTFKILLIVLLVVSGFFLLLIDFTIIWAVLVIVFACFWLYEYSISPVTVSGFPGFLKKIPVITSILLIVAVLAFWKGDTIAGPMITKLNVSQTEVFLPWQLSLDVGADTIKESPFFGAGPNRFSNQYLKFKPLIVNSTAFWNTEFNSGFGLIPTFFVTQGLVGMVLWLLFIVVFVFTGYKALRKKNDNLSQFFITSTFFSSLFLWIVSLVYVPSHFIVFLTFIVSALFLSLIVDRAFIPKKYIPTLLIVIIAILVLWLAVYVKKTIAFGYFQGGISALNVSNNQGLDKAEGNFKKALSFDRNDTYYQALSEINILRVTALAQQVQQTGKAADADSIKKAGALIDQAMTYSKAAIGIDPSNYYNYIESARISEIALSLQAPSSYEATKAAYFSALKYNPYNPAIYLNLARIEASQNKLNEATQFIGSALQLKQNYLDAIFLLSQIQVTQGKINDAITSVQVASQINPTNPIIFFQLGLLYYNNKDYTNAISALSQAIKIDNNYANAQYFLGLAYARVGKLPDAISQFEALSRTNADNQEVALILSNLKAGKSPFADAKSPIDNKPEQRKTLPIKEKADTKTPLK